LTGLVIIFAYVLALGIAAGCILLCVGALGAMSLGSLVIFVGGASCAAAILWSILPRRDKFDPPGPVIEPAAQPRLFAEIAKIAGEFDEPMPSAVYLMFEPNAWVAQRGGMLGAGSRRVMALGLPLLSVLTVSELRSVLAHEFAHYYGGDTSLGPWIRKAQESLGRSLQSLTSDTGLFSFLSRMAYIALLRLLVVGVFVLYWKLFLRLTLLASRQWEYRADELACAVGGAEPLLSGLSKIDGAAFAWPSFWQSEAVPPLEAGFRPPLAEGFARFLAAPSVSGKVESLVAEHQKNAKPNAFDTHPTFKQRSSRASSLPYETPDLNDAPALSLFDSVPDMELSALQPLIREAKIAPPKPVAWELIGPVMYIPLWRGFTEAYREILLPYTIGDIPTALANLPQIAAQIRDPKGTLLTREQRAERCLSLVWMAFTVTLLANGWRLRAAPGECSVHKDGQALAPNELIHRLKEGAITEADYRALADRLGIAHLPLARGAAGEAVGASSTPLSAPESAARIGNPTP
jgi:Zn-dependent protease with chaperone function